MKNTIWFATVIVAMIITSWSQPAVAGEQKSADGADDFEIDQIRHVERARRRELVTGGSAGSTMIDEREHDDRRIRNEHRDRAGRDRRPGRR